MGRALTISGGEAQLEDVVLQGTRGGALHLIGGVLRMLRCSLLDNEAVDGGALLVSGGEAFVSATHFSRNNATQTGGAICVENGTLVISNGTLLESLRGKHKLREWREFAALDGVLCESDSA